MFKPEEGKLNMPRFPPGEFWRPLDEVSLRRPAYRVRFDGDRVHTEKIAGSPVEVERRPWNGAGRLSHSTFLPDFQAHLVRRVSRRSLSEAFSGPAALSQ